MKRVAVIAVLGLMVVVLVSPAGTTTMRVAHGLIGAPVPTVIVTEPLPEGIDL